MADLKELLRNLASLKKRGAKGNPIHDKRMRELLKKIEIAKKAGPGDAIRKRSPHDLMLKKKKKNTPSIGSATKMKDEDEEEIDWEKEREKRSHQTAEEMYGLGGGAADPGGFMPYDSPYKKGGRIKKPKKKTKKRKRAALRGYRAELRGG